jgi:lipopolysaccharide biosynthesis protein
VSGLLGDAKNVARIVESFVAHPKLGILMLPHWRGVSRVAGKIGPNFEAMQLVLGRARLAISVEQPIEFPSGSMFWFRSEALAPLLGLGLTWEDFYGCRPRDVDGTIAHGIERCMLWFAAKAGYRWAFLPKPSPARIWRARRSAKLQTRQAALSRSHVH